MLGAHIDIVSVNVVVRQTFQLDTRLIVCTVQ